MLRVVSSGHECRSSHAIRVCHAKLGLPTGGQTTDWLHTLHEPEVQPRTVRPTFNLRPISAQTDSGVCVLSACPARQSVTRWTLPANGRKHKLKTALPKTRNIIQRRYHISMILALWYKCT